MICLVYFDALYINIYCLVISRLHFLTRANDHKLSFCHIEVTEMGWGLRIYKDTGRVTALVPDWKTTSCYARHVLIQTT